MNIISNNCLGGFIYKDFLQIKYENPFIFSRMNYEDFLYLLVNYENINFENFELIKESDKLEKFRIIIDNKIKVQFNHYKFDKDCIISTVKIFNDEKTMRTTTNVYYNKIWEYIVEKYEQRIKRMSKKIDLIALDVDDKNDIDVNKILEVCKKKNYIVFACTNKIPEETSDNIIVRKRIQHYDRSPQPSEVWQDYQEEIKTLLKIKG